MIRSIQICGLLALCAVALSACSSVERVTLRYTPSETALRQAGRVRPMKVGAFEDRRRKDPYYLGTMRGGGGGNPFKELQTDEPVASVMRGFFIESLRNRAKLDRSSRYELTGSILALEANQFVRGEVYLRLVLVLTDSRSGRQIAVVPLDRDKMFGGILSVQTPFVSNPDVFARKISRVLSDATDRGIREVSKPSPTETRR